MHVLHAIPSVDPRDGGPTTVVSELLRRGRDATWRMTLVTTDKGLSRSVESSEGVVVRSYPPKRLTFAPAFARVVSAELGSADLLHVHGAFNYPSAVAAKAARRLSKPYILQPHGVFDDYHMGQRAALKGVWAKSMEPGILRDAAVILVSSERERRGVMAHEPNASVTVLPLGVDDDLFRIKRTLAPEPVVLFLGRLAEKKGLDLLLDSIVLTEIRRRGARVVIAGPVHHDLPASVRERLGHAQAAGLIEHVGSVDAQGRRDLLGRATVFVLPSRDESFGVAAAEAVAAGVPVVLSREVGVAEELERQGLVQVVDLTAQAIARAIVQVLEAPDAGEEAAARARVFAKAQFAWPAIVDQYRDICRSITASSE